MNNYHIGHFAEFVALIFLRLHGYKKVAINYITGKGTKAGEIDLIVCKKNTLVFVEVKKRQDLGTAAYSILPKQQQRIRKAAENFIAINKKYQNFDIRFDAVLFSRAWKIKHLKNAF